jgi:DNA-binding SARP family transcriptional activator
MARNDPHAPAVEFRFFGAPAVFMDGNDATSSFSKRALWMIAMLAFSESKSIDRQHLASSLWPDSSDTSALHNLRQTLAAVRRSLGDAKELVSGGTKAVELRLSPEVAIDVLDFDANCKESSPASLEKAVEVFAETFSQVATSRSRLLRASNESMRLSPLPTDSWRTIW